jgi:antitoxin component YwqK of YwqJK toxin-antitoxin module
MLEKKIYSNGQKVYDLEADMLTYFFKTGRIKAKGRFINGKMEGEWRFYRETGQLWVVGNFKNGMKNGTWLRYDKNDKLEYHEVITNDKTIKQK